MIYILFIFLLLPSPNIPKASQFDIFNTFRINIEMLAEEARLNEKN